MKMTRKAKRVLTTVLSVVLGLGAVLGVAVGVKHLANKEDDGLKKIRPNFSVGSLSTVGKYVDSEGSIYTKEAFECQGLKITLDFEDTISYKIFFYEDNGDFISSTELLEDSSTPTLPSGATHARIQIVPDWEALDITNAKEQVINWYEVSKYTKQMEIKVNKEQGEYVLGEYVKISLTNSKFEMVEGQIMNVNGNLTESNYNTYIYTATEDCSFYVENEGLAAVQYVAKDSSGSLARFQVTDGTWKEGKINALELKAGESVYISVQDNLDFNNLSFYLATFKIV